jgi:hypothetical protein
MFYKLGAALALAGLCLGVPAQAIENHVQSTPTDVFFFSSGFTPPPSEFGTFGFRDAYSNAASISPTGGKPAIQSKVSVNVSTLSWVYMTNYRLLGANYGFVVVQPYFDFNGGIKGTANAFIPGLGPISIPVNQRDHVTGYGQTQIYPILLQWLDLPHIAVNASVAIQFPDGRYSKTALLNPSTNYYTVLPNFALTYISNFGQEISTYQEIDINGANTATHYRSGDEYKMTVAAGQHIGDFTVGPAGYYYQQLQNDSGSGAHALGASPQAARVFGAGLAADYIVRGKPYAVFGSFIKEFAARNHAQGIAASLRLSYSF